MSEKQPVWLIVGIKSTPEEVETKVLGFSKHQELAERLGLIRGSTEGFEIGTFDITKDAVELGTEWREWFTKNGLSPAEAAAQIRQLAASVKAGYNLYKSQPQN